MSLSMLLSLMYMAWIRCQDVLHDIKEWALCMCSLYGFTACELLVSLLPLLTAYSGIEWASTSAPFPSRDSRSTIYPYVLG